MNRYNAKKPSLGLTIGKMTLLVFLSIITLLLLAVYLFLNFDIYKPGMDNNNNYGLDNLPGITDETEEPFTTDENYVPATAAATQTAGTKSQRKSDEYVFLVAARDRISSNTDVIMIINFNVKTNKVSIMQVPRDTYVNLKGHSVKKMNAVFSYSYADALNAKKNNKAEATKIGIQSMENMIKSTFALPIDRYIFVDTKGFRALVDLVGGVEMYVPRNMNYEDPEQNLYIHLNKGQQTLNGEKAEQYVRYRAGYPDGDIGRLNAQKLFLSALVKKILKTPLTQINNFIDLSKEYVTTDINALDMLYFAKELIDVKPENIRIQNLPGEELNVNKGAYYGAYKTETVEMVNKYYNPYKTEISAGSFDMYEFKRKYTTKPDIDGKTFDTFN